MTLPKGQLEQDQELTGYLLHRLNGYEITSPEYANGAVRQALKDGVLEKSPCIFCKSPDVVAHHQDYAKPLDVMWLCKSHHSRWHHALRKSGGGPRNTDLDRSHLDAERRKQRRSK